MENTNLKRTLVENGVARDKVRFGEKAFEQTHTNADEVAWLSIIEREFDGTLQMLRVSRTERNIIGIDVAVNVTYA